MTADLRAAIEAQLEEVRIAVADESRATGFCIGNTAKPSPLGWFVTPVRHSPSIVAGSVIVYSDELAREVATIVDGAVDYVFVDAEKKLRREAGSEYVPNPERIVRESVTKSRIMTYKGNDLVVEAVDTLLSQLSATNPRGIGGMIAAVIGAGNVGSKIALRLVERGVGVRLYRRSSGALAEIVNGLNRIVPAGTTARIEAAASALLALQGAQIVVGATDGIAAIDAPMIDRLTADAVLIEAGKGSMNAEAIRRALMSGHRVIRVDVRAAFAGYAETVLRTQRNIEMGLTRRVLDDFAIVSAGLVGLRGDVVVDNAVNPRVVFGVADGAGDFVRDPASEFKGRADEVRRWIDRMRRGGAT
jgi:hypothetical protein